MSVTRLWDLTDSTRHGYQRTEFWGKVGDRLAGRWGHRYYTRPHKMKVVDNILDGKYFVSSQRMALPKELMEAMGMLVSSTLLTGQKPRIPAYH